MIKLENKVARQSEAIKMPQSKIENQTEHVIKCGATLDLLMRARELKKLK